MTEDLRAALTATAAALAELSDEEILVEWFRGRRLLKEIRDRLEKTHGKDLDSRRASWAKEKRSMAAKRGAQTLKEHLRLCELAIQERWGRLTERETEAIREISCKHRVSFDAAVHIFRSGSAEPVS
jgi:hypothetical protein